MPGCMDVVYRAFRNPLPLMQDDLQNKNRIPELRENTSADVIQYPVDADVVISVSAGTGRIVLEY